MSVHQFPYRHRAHLRDELDNARPLYRLRNWLIRRLAGHHMIVLNARMAFVYQESVEAFKVRDADGCMLCNNTFPIGDNGLILELSQRCDHAKR